MSNELKSLVRKIETEMSFTKLADMLREYFNHPETLPMDGKSLIADMIIARAFDLGANNMALRVGHGLASLAK